MLGLPGSWRVPGRGNVAANPMKGTFFEQVYAVVAGIPKGKVMSYGQIARVLEHQCSARYVGFAMASAPEGRNLPCHRVVNRQGAMSPGFVFGGEEVQRALLEAEGVPFLANGRVDMNEAVFEPE